MQTLLRGKDYIETPDWTKEELETVLNVADDLKKRFALGEAHRLLQGKSECIAWDRKCHQLELVWQCRVCSCQAHLWLGRGAVDGPESARAGVRKLLCVGMGRYRWLGFA